MIVMIDLSKTVGTLLERLEQIRVDRPSAGTKYRLMGIALDIGELTQQMKDEVLEKVSREIVLDADADIDYGEMSQHILTKELEENAVQDEIRVQQGVVNQALAALSDMMDKIATQLTRHRHDEEYAKLYETEYRRYMTSSAARRSRQTFEEWRDNECGGHPSQEDIEDYRLEKVLQLFNKGVFDAQVEHIQRAKRYPGELDFDLPGDQTKISKTVFHHYAALRRIVDFKDGSLVVNPASAGRHFYVNRHNENAKAHRTAFLKYMHKVDMAQQELRNLAARAESARLEEAEEVLNLFAPAKHLKLLLQEEWFAVLTTDDKRYNGAWAECFVDALMASAWGEQIARDWAVKDKRLTLKCMIVGMLKDAGVLRGSYSQIAKLLNMDGENADTLAKYLGLGKKQAYADWITEYTNPALSD